MVQPIFALQQINIIAKYKYTYYNYIILGKMSVECENK